MCLVLYLFLVAVNLAWGFWIGLWYGRAAERKAAEERMYRALRMAEARAASANLVNSGKHND